jgi:hypothetical protein
MAQIEGMAPAIRVKVQYVRSEYRVRNEISKTKLGRNRGDKFD